jgi:hypothetical protein
MSVRTIKLMNGCLLPHCMMHQQSKYIIESKGASLLLGANLTLCNTYLHFE